jgi:hypothetical protein
MADMNKSLCTGIDKAEYLQVGARVDALSKEVLEIVFSIVEGICAELNNYMSVIDEVLKDSSAVVTDAELEDFIMNLTSILYTVSEGQERLGVEEDVAKAIHKEVYSRVREKAQGTVADKDTAADLASQNEAIVYMVKARAYRLIKSKVELGFEMVNTLKKVITRRIAEIELSRTTRGG